MDGEAGGASLLDERVIHARICHSCQEHRCHRCCYVPDMSMCPTWYARECMQLFFTLGRSQQLRGKTTNALRLQLLPL